MDFKNFFKYFFNYRNTVIRVAFSMALSLSVEADSISNLEDLIITLGGVILGSVVAEIIIRTIFYIFFSNKK